MRSKFAAFVLTVVVLGCLGAPGNLVANDFAKSMRSANDFIRQGDYESAVREYEKALRCKKQSSEAQSWLGIAYERWGDRLFKDGDTDRAIEAYRKALAAVSDDPFWHEQLGMALDKKGDHEAAMKEFRSATELLPLDGGLKRKYEVPSGEHQGSGDPEFATVQSGEHIKTVGGMVNQPRPIYKPDPHYSERARRARLNGSLEMWVVIDREGNVVSTSITKPLGLGLDAMALETVRTWKFQPATRDGTAVPVRVKVAVSFRLF